MLRRSGQRIIRTRLSLMRKTKAFSMLLPLMAIASLTVWFSASWDVDVFDGQSGSSEASLPLVEAQSDEKPSLTIITRISPNTYYESDQGPSGFEYALLQRFALFLDTKLEILTTDSLAELNLILERGEADLASAGLSPVEGITSGFNFTDPYLQSQSYVVYKVGHRKPRVRADLVNHNIEVAADSTHSSLLRQIKVKHPTLQWRESYNVDYLEVLRKVETGEIDYTLIDSKEFILHQGFFPQVKKAFEIGPTKNYAWMLPRDSKELLSQANSFLQSITDDGQLAMLEERYYGQAARFSQVDANEFSKSISQRLPLFRKQIEKTATDFDMDWRMLAAVSYQESRWNPLARSRTGVRGFMMLTLPTANEVGVTDRLDPEQSLFGGATYLVRLKDRLPERIKEPDRSWFALAAYNVGYGHLEDARKITQGRGDNPDSWYDVQKSLPLLTQKKWHSKTRYGYARGYEPVQYVQNIRHYFHVLQWNDLANSWRKNRIVNNALFSDDLLNLEYLAPINDSTVGSSKKKSKDNAAIKTLQPSSTAAPAALKTPPSLSEFEYPFSGAELKKQDSDKDYMPATQASLKKVLVQTTAIATADIAPKIAIKPQAIEEKNSGVGHSNQSNSVKGAVNPTTGTL